MMVNFKRYSVTLNSKAGQISWFTDPGVAFETIVENYNRRLKARYDIKVYEVVDSGEPRMVFRSAGGSEECTQLSG